MDSATDDNILNPNLAMNFSRNKPGLPGQEDASDLKEIVKKVTSEFALRASQTIKSDYSIDDFVVLTDKPYILGISSEGYLIVINTLLLSFHNIKLSSGLDKIVMNSEETLAFIFDYDSQFIVVEIPSGTVVTTIKKMPSDISNLRFIPPNKIVACSDEGHIHTLEWDGNTLKKIKTVRCAMKEPYQAVLSNNAKMLLMNLSLIHI